MPTIATTSRTIQMRLHSIWPYIRSSTLLVSLSMVFSVASDISLTYYWLAKVSALTFPRSILLR